MNIETVINELSHYQKGVFPRKALEAAIEQQQTITPRLLDYLERIAADPQQMIDGDDTDLVMFAVYLLAQFREPQAYPLIVKLVSCDSETVDYLLGDVITESLGRILASVCDGDLQPLKKLVESNRANEYVRSAALHSFVTLYSENAISRDEILAFFKAMFRQHPLREENHIWNSLCHLSEGFRFVELLPDIRRAFEDNLTDRQYSALEDYEEGIQKTDGDGLEVFAYDKGYITDTIAELQSWACFRPEPARPAASKVTRQDYPGTFVHDQPKVGRNDPCPCGSGKKFKKCCG